ncbi:MAG: DNA cytosine methyltransferase [Armatimonadetes bacterium]|nr:MAG: DNA cytosine methyltransferase [Armatimonadota bacterium]
MFKFAELFCGPGGLSLGAVLASISNGTLGPKVQAVWANDIDPDTCETYRRNIHPDNPMAVLCGPVEKIDFEDVPHFDALAFGFPCNDFSQVGEQKGFRGYYGPLYTNAIRAINEHNPDWFIAENVSGLRSANSGHAFAQILKDLEEAGMYGYELTPNLYCFEDYGVPQIRHRIVIIGIRKDIGLKFKVPSPTHKVKKVSVKEAIENPPITREATNNEFTRQSAVVIERLKHIPPGKNAWYDGIPHHLRLNVKGARMSQIYKRLNPDKPSYTITGSGGGGTHVYHWQEPRALTNRERARIQTFPDDFVFVGTKESVRKQIGMAVPVLGAKVIIEAVLKTFSEIPYEAVDPNVNMAEIKKRGAVSEQIISQIQ